MTAPAQAFRHLLTAIGMGLGLGLVYGFLRPVRRGKAIVPDLILVAFACWLSILLGFGVCGGDLRPGYWAGLLGGAFLWEATLGRLLRRPFSAFWDITGRILAFPWNMMKKITKKLTVFRKKYLHLGKNRVQ